MKVWEGLAKLDQTERAIKAQNYKQPELQFAKLEVPIVVVEPEQAIAPIAKASKSNWNPSSLDELVSELGKLRF